MKKKTNVALIEAPEMVIDGLAELKAKEAELKAKKRLLMEVELRNKWENDTLKRNPCYIKGSLRQGTDEDKAILGHVHGQVCNIKCSVCGKERLVNKQDAKQVITCKECRKVSLSNKNKEKRVTKRLSSISKEDLERQIAELNKQLGSL